jgi:tRNA(Ile)-lysidine synthase
VRAERWELQIVSASLVSRVARALRDDRLAGAGDRVVVALSGGPDSVALAWLLRDALPEVGAELVGLAHLNHRLRGEDADADEAFCRDVAASLHLGIEVEACDVRGLARGRRQSIETAAHDERYAFLERVRVRLGATRIATGHTRNDQAETVLLRLVRGAGLTGLAGIRPRHGAVIRPLLGVGREAIEAFLRDRALAFRVDASNSDPAIARNRVRHEVLPLLRDRCSPRVVEALARAARLAADDDEFLEGLATDAGATLVKRTENTLRVDLQGLSRLPRALQRRLVWRALRHVGGCRVMTADHVGSVLALMANPERTGRIVTLPGGYAHRDGGVLVVGARRPELRAELAARPLQSADSTKPRHLPIPGFVEDSRGDWLVSVSPRAREPGPDRLRSAPQQAAVDASAVGGRLFVRTRRPGDRFQPLGLGGHKKLQDFFVDRKVAREERDRVPLVVDAQDRIVWVAGHAIAEDFRVTPATTGVLLFELSPLRRLV